MRKIILLVYLSSFLIWNSCYALAATHLEKLKVAYPYGLLGEDYDLLTMDDLAFNACVAAPQPLSSESIDYPYWQCFKTENIQFECDHGGKQESGTPIQALMVLVIQQTSKRIEYLAPATMDLSSCREYENDWKRLTKGQKNVCVSGPLIRFVKDRNSEYDSHWVFDKFKTRKGCVSYFDGYCSTMHKPSPCEGSP